MPYTVEPTSLPGVLVLQPRLFEDARGFFFESFNQRDFEAATGVTRNFVQDNHSKSTKGVLRGLHYQIQKPQGKLVRVIRGEVFDVAVDLRRSSPHFGKWIGITLSAANRTQLWIPEGFAHGFYVRSETAEFLYKTTDYWSPENERCLRWDDPTVAIAWSLEGAPELTEKDCNGALLQTCETFV